MSSTDLWPWITLAALGAYHGINPAMGWLFAVALGLQERSRGAVFSAFPPIALGHAASVALVVGVVVVGRAIVPIDALKIMGCVALVSFGIYKLVRSSHPRWVGMRVGFRDLTAWSFLMASAHGAGLMLVPILLRLPGYGGQVIDLRDVPACGVHVARRTGLHRDARIPGRRRRDTHAGDVRSDGGRRRDSLRKGRRLHTPAWLVQPGQGVGNSADRRGHSDAGDLSDGERNKKLYRSCGRRRCSGDASQGNRIKSVLTYEPGLLSKQRCYNSLHRPEWEAQEGPAR